jgi:hypothetical protein
MKSPVAAMAVLAVGLGLTACSSSTDSAVALSETRISIADDIISAGVAAPTLSLSVNGVLVAISPDTVTSLTIEVAEIQYLPVAESEDDAGGWQSLELDTVELDLMALPTEGDESFVIGSGLVPVGSYQMVRLMASGGEIVFNGPITVGPAAFDADTEYPVTIPSGDQTGLKTDVSFEVTEGDGGTANAAYLVFEAGTTFQNVSVQGTGTIILAPVLRAPQE